MTIQTNNKVALPKTFLQQESYSGLCHPRSLLCHSRSKVGVGRIIKTGRECYWLNRELQITVGFCWQIRRFLCEGCFEEETIPTDRSTLSHNRPHPVSTAFTLSRLLLSIISLKNTNTSTNTNTNTNITSKKGAKIFALRSADQYQIWWDSIFSKSECDQAMEENINRIYCDHVNM